MYPYDSSQQQGPFSAPGIPGDQAGPLANLQDEVAAALNGNGGNPRVYIPGGQGEPVFQAPNPQFVLRDLFAGIFRLFRR